MTGSANDVVDDNDSSRFVLERAGSTAELVHRNEPGRLMLIHTDVPDPLVGRGIGGRTVHSDAMGGIDIDASMPSNGRAHG
jgi:predicted GNAT family acetyltransferase